MVASKKVRGSRVQESTPERYHHGDLKSALIRATDELLAERGLEGFSLREVSRRAGVSPAAPAHHFGSAAGLLSEVAMLSFIELTQRLDVSGVKGTPARQLQMQGLGYVRFALTYPGRFHLMFRRDLLSDEHAGLHEAGEAALAQLEQTVRKIRSLAADKPLDATAQSMLLATWSMVHGFAHLMLDGKLAHMYAGATPDALIESVLPAMLLPMAGTFTKRISQTQWRSAADC